MNRRERRRAARRGARTAPPSGAPPVGDLLAAAVERHAAGDLAEAESLYRSALARRPRDGDALRLLGALLRGRGATDEAARLLERAVSLRPRDAAARLELARLELARGDPVAAERLARAAIAIDRRLGEAHSLLAAALLAGGRQVEAEAAARRAVALDADDAAARELLGRALEAQPHAPEGPPLRRADWHLHQGRFAEALAAYEAAAEAGAEPAESALGRGRALLGLDEHGPAREAFEQALAARPDSAIALVYLGNALYGEGRMTEALAAYDRAAAIRPRFANAHFNRAIALEALGRYAEAATVFARVMAIEPGNGPARLRRAVALRRAHLPGARAALEEALALMPESVEALAHLATLYRDRGDAEKAIPLYRRALARAPGLARLHSAFLVTLQCAPGIDGARLLAEHRAWARRHAGPTPPRPPAEGPGRRLRIGYVSPDFRSHSVAYFIAPVIAAHDRATFEVVAYADVAAPDAMTERLRGAVDDWRETTGLDDETLAERVRADRIDVLVDLSGHMEGHRLGVFARRPAPLQITWLGYPGTTGLEAIDARLSDAIADPPGSEAHHAEALVRLEKGFLCWEPPAESPQGVAPPAIASEGTPTFASFTALAKLNPPLVAAWAAILKASPGSRLILKDQAFVDADVRAHVSAAFATHGIAAERIELRRWQASKADHLASYADVDVALDTFPYNGTATICEALWMGVPVVTLAGDRHAARVGASLLHAVGLDELVAEDAETYVTVATELAGDGERLARLRAELRGRMAASPLMDAAGFTRRLEAAYREMWRRWCAECR